MALSSCAGSTSHGHRSGDGRSSIWIVSPSVLASRPRISDSSAATSTERGRSGCWREKASNRWVSCEARLQASSASVPKSPSCPSSWMPIAIISRLPMMTVSRLLKSWATPPVR